MTAGEVRALADDIEMRLVRAPFGPTAIVTQDNVFFGIARMLEIVSDVHNGPAFEVLGEKDIAVQWLLSKVR